MSTNLEPVIGYRVSRLSNTLARAADYRYGRECGVSVAEWRCIAVLADLRAASLAQLCGRTLVDKAWISRTLRRLVDRGWVNSRNDPSDARRVIFRLTASGRATNRRLLQISAARNQELLQDFDATELRLLYRQLDCLQTRAQHMLDQERALGALGQRVVPREKSNMPRRAR